MDKEKHLELIENIISRMANCSFLIKGWTLTIVAAVFGLAAKDSDIKFVIIAYVIIPCFWFLDAFYLSKERQYRSLYDNVRNNSDTDFSMNTSEFNNGKNTWLNSIFSKTLNLFYIPLICIILVIMFVFKHI
ncbi:hypothetical protein [Treponema socranskii]|uniref:hypothetical protein n=1 Tax=Treponema socranskii TaxID=53419 RepID=UPI003D6E8EAA